MGHLNVPSDFTEHPLLHKIFIFEQLCLLDIQMYETLLCNYEYVMLVINMCVADNQIFIHILNYMILLNNKFILVCLYVVDLHYR